MTSSRTYEQEEVAVYIQDKTRTGLVASLLFEISTLATVTILITGLKLRLCIPLSSNSMLHCHMHCQVDSAQIMLRH